MIPIVIPEIFKYNSVLSIPLFAVIALLLIRKAPDFSFSKHTVSKSVLFLNSSTCALIFRFNFLFKGLLDLGFVFYLLYFFKTSLTSLPALCLILSALLFGSLAYFVEGVHTVVHRIVAYGSGVLWAYGQLYFGYLTGDTFFRQFTNIMVTIPIMLAFGFMFAKKTNVVVQALCMAMWYIWLVVFVFKYL